MMSNRWTMLLRNQVVATVLLLVVLVPLVFAGSDASRTAQMTLYGFLGLTLFAVWAFRARDRVALARVRALLMSGPNLPILLYVVWNLITVLFSSEPYYSQFAFMQLAFGVLLYSMVVYQFRHREQVRALLSTVLVVGVALVLFALYQDRSRKMLDTGLVGSFHDRQLFGAFLLLILPVAFGIAAGTRNRIWKIGSQLGSILILGGLLMTKCRSAWLGVAVAIGTFLLLSLIYVWKLRAIEKKKHELLITPALGLVVVALFLTFTGMGGPLQIRAMTFSTIQQDDSVKDRVGLAQVGMRVIQARPLTGWGPGSYAFAQARFASQLGLESRSDTVIRQLGPSLTESPHNTYIQIASEQGLPGLVLYLVVLVAFFTAGIKALPRLDRGLRKYTLIGCLAAIAGQCVDGIANPAWMYPEVSTFFWVVIGVGMCAAGLGQAVRDEEEAAGEAPILGLPRFLYRGLRTAAFGSLVLLCAAHLWNLNLTPAAAGAPPPPGGGGGDGSGLGNPNRPIYCDFITRLDVDFLNDNIPPTRAFDINTGAIPVDRIASFKVYALTDDPRFFADVTTERRQIKFKLIGLKGKISYSESSNIARFFYTPTRKMGGKTGTIEISYKCTKPTEIYRTRFTLTVLPNRDPIDQSASTVRVVPSGADGVRFRGADPYSFEFPGSDLLKLAFPVSDVEETDGE